MRHHTKHHHNHRRKQLTGEALAYYRKVVGMTQHQVRRATGLSFHRLSYAETDPLKLHAKEQGIPLGLYRRRTGRAITPIVEREQEIADIAARTVGRKKDSIRRGTVGLQKFVRGGVADARKLLTARQADPAVARRGWPATSK